MFGARKRPPRMIFRLIPAATAMAPGDFPSVKLAAAAVVA